MKHYSHLPENDGAQAWKRTVACSFLAQVLSILGFSFALPFLPFFIRDLGIVEQSQQAWWAGVTLAASGVTMAIFAPVWGILADRFGRKSMVLRSMFGGTVVLLLMSFSRNVGDLLVCRLLQGMLTGTVSASIALVASVTPQKRSGMAMGLMQSAVFVGVAIGPLLGGLIADMYGYRSAFRLGAIIVLIGGLLVYYGTDENFTPPEPESESERLVFMKTMFNSGFVVAIMVLLAVRFANTIVNPSFPLVIHDIVESTERLNSIAGTIMALAGVAGAISAGVLGHIGDRVGHYHIVVFASLGAAATAAAHALAQTIPQLAVVHLLFGFAVAGTMPAANAMIQRNIDPRHMGKAFGIASAISMSGLALGPLTGGFLASQFNIRAPFLAAGVCQVLVAVLVVCRWRKITGTL